MALRAPSRNSAGTRRSNGTAQPDLLEGFLAKQLRAAQQTGEIEAGRNPEMTAAGMLALVNGLGSSVLGGQRTGEAALAILTHHLDELFRPASAGLDDRPPLP
ncbi:hypothetical protein P3T36_004168 [Kitasatospora sp. MAP12-15]|uniref:TetR family transcriptional regulator C-terminal domain-containing protein n=1 Tax=unclassified Kitasatospora TaxID=2633591 RepID=UPI0024745F96|nr:TetR family transcriptional regulator C-terminal domain-containing protein [Kitasatospora sp. MAP12-44]MDH6115249.1 hypothetical protein [Kitasatospora sp. MAP12-44]